MPSEKHVAVCAFPFGSHPWVLANLVGKLAAAAGDVRFSFLSTAKSNVVVFPPPSRAASIPSNLRVYDIGDGLPTGYHDATGDPRDPADLFLRAASANFQAGVDIAERDAGRKVSLLLADGLITVVGCEVAEKMRVPWVSFWVSAPHSLSIHVYADLIHQLSRDATDEEQTLDMIPGLSLMRMVDLPEELAMDPNMSTICRMFRELGNVIPRAAAVVMNSFVEMDPEPLTADLKSKFSILLYLGMLTLAPPSLPASDETGCLPWLDSRGSQTVVYISFGSGPLTSPPPDEIASLAEALESTGTPFLWSLTDRLKAQCLPRGFEERTAARGRIVPWAPQREVLGHPACGAFVTHCGYNSVFESMAAGVPMIGRPVAVDQRICGKLVEEVWGIGVRVEGGVLSKSGMVKALEVVLRSEEGKAMRKKVGELREKLAEAAGPGGRAAADFKALVELISTL
ncbi:anthocyanidin 3-O-glucosyltransferase 7-like [Syzygium oleosum]|uniref:anthocyanidin 3-O-glucosyltransferase 7-like n=1 Tax=Syzygium oleosum TaxID=219896 RepID=UPI0024B98C4D|nr:anthocyanidin 3-O-glucosyltransferase 7-like [Syzygium oleosum]